ncbi:penicillin acylase family protein [Fodinibius halophilus]|uniref:Penicillin acylase family protein n=1 Tax=Fodinibius halophilus TaxID=1736908 RepID=A0A6M1T573_9BACT|nr:penicillin acylase family protein [Fodinibius halophilus]NGP89229.1 penicillin acylase family protein [Fodinibius halophilus]
MKKAGLKLGISGIVTALFFWLLSVPLGPAPPLGKFWNPQTGFWANTQNVKRTDHKISVASEALSDSVTVFFDQHQIPHIFASNNHDLYFTQGYITARDRLWQMELQTHAAAGRLSEILGSRTLQYDRYQRHIGMNYAAEQALEKLMAHPKTAEAVEAYAAGVNAWIDQLDPSEYPLEYKFLDYRPETWTPLKTALLLKNMTYTLAGSNSDLRMSNTRAFFGDSFIKKVLDISPPLNDPIIPESKDWNFESQAPEKPQHSFTPAIVDTVAPFQPDPNNGSNNWAVSGSKTANGYPILANDPHLNMTLPSIWYSLQLHGPDQNVMGVSLPGAPAVIIGYNENIAWGTTNVGADVWDWYEITFRDSTFSHYNYDGEWHPTTKRVEKIKVKGESTVTDTVVYTHHGPVVQTSGDEPMRSNIPKYHAMQWIAHEKSNELRYFLDINKADNYDDYRQALQHYESPAQNWVFADSSNIALTVTGKYPLKWDEQGRFIGDGSNPSYDWQGWIPFDQIPHVKNPDRGFVSSANQDPAGDSYPYYLDDDFAPYERGRRINEQLASMEDITPKEMQKLQMDLFSYHAKSILPTLLQHVKTDTLSNIHKKAVTELTEWKYENKGELIAPSLFNAWWDELYEAIWSDEYQQTDIPMEWPSRDQVVTFLHNNSSSKWYDNINTPEKETLKQLINRSFNQAILSLQNKHGDWGDSWKWGYINDTDIRHVGRLPGLGRENVFTGGGGESVNAIRGSHGPSWRMVVQLGPEIKGWGIYPGGQSGNPGSKYYDNMIDEWRDGELFPLWFMRQPPTATDSLHYTITLN